MPQVTPLTLGGGLVALAEGVLGAVALAKLGPERIALFLVACSLATGLMTAVLHVLLSHGGPGETDGPDGGGDSAGPPPPPWWPEFERGFWHHVQRGERAPV